MTPVLAGGFSTTAPPGKPYILLFEATQFVVICHGCPRKLYTQSPCRALGAQRRRTTRPGPGDAEWLQHVGAPSKMPLRSSTRWGARTQASLQTGSPTEGDTTEAVPHICIYYENSK